MIIQINSQFYMNEAQWIKDYTGYGVVNLIVKEGKLKIDSTEPIREVKQTYESKYGVVEWEDYNFSQKEDEIPEIHIEINETNELEIVFNPAVNYPPL
ncbi:hypothetical protein, partial [Bacillus smithii]|uniref:hypothetical protein n=1 Tax=Bacillus smithii TaxID=1479 RepID=UPI003D1F28C3